MSHKNVPRKIGKGIVGDLIRPVSNVELSSIVFLFFISKLVLGILGLGQTWEFFSFEEEWAKTGQMSNYYIQPASRPIFNRELQQAQTQALHYYTTLLLNGNTWKEMLMGFSPDGTYPFSHLSLSLSLSYFLDKFSHLLCHWFGKQSQPPFSLPVSNTNTRKKRKL